MSDYTKSVHAQADDYHLLHAYIGIKDALDEIAKVREKDRYLTQIQSSLYKMEDMLYQYCTDDKRRKK